MKNVSITLLILAAVIYLIGSNDDAIIGKLEAVDAELSEVEEYQRMRENDDR